MYRFLEWLKKILVRFAPYLAGAVFSAALVLFIMYAYYDKGFETAARISAVGVAILLAFLLGYIGCTSGSGDLASSMLNGDEFSRRKKASVLVRKGLNALERREIGEALNLFKDAESCDMTEDEQAMLANLMGACYKIGGYPTNAGIYFRKAIDHGMDSPEIYLDAARCFTASGSFDDALECYGHLTSLDPVPECVYNDLGMLWLKKGIAEKALEYFSLSAEKHMNYSFALGGCSLSYLLMKDFEKSRTYYSLAIVNGVPDMSGFKEYYAEIANSVDYKADFLDLNTPPADENDEETANV